MPSACDCAPYRSAMNNPNTAPETSALETAPAHDRVVPSSHAKAPPGSLAASPTTRAQSSGPR